ncbi:flavodoxin [Nitrogeniibacter mangrovi]|uniref:Flavodoxin n=1 Tax=Nitrogeniibacter mangrovi TaxID=2016596 RepID=A0A6C1B7Z4_9RHOO|nr:flavodoxin [Nitrogeniibacter mangrovi]QID19493.1 flavodoxin [Nitrogeniibacter mangrovi]
MTRLGIFFGTETGRTRRLAKQIAQRLADDHGVPVDTPANIGRTSVDDFLACDAFILGTPTLGEGELPGLDTGLAQPSWAEFLPGLPAGALTGKTVAIFGLGDQEKYPEHFVDAIGLLYDALTALGARAVGRWPTAGYTFTGSVAVDGDDFLGLAIDPHAQAGQTDARVDAWLARVVPELVNVKEGV